MTTQTRRVVVASAALALLAGVAVSSGSALAQQPASPPAAAPPAAVATPQVATPTARPGTAPGTFIGAESTVVGGAGVIKAAPSGPAAATGEGHENDYPTVARADYVFACMQVNGQSRDILEKCSCSIDVIASLLSYEKYEEAETIMSVRQRGGKATDLWSASVPKEMIKSLKRAQIEGELRCF